MKTIMLFLLFMVSLYPIAPVSNDTHVSNDAPVSNDVDVVRTQYVSSRYDFSEFHKLMKNKSREQEESWYWYSKVPVEYQTVVKRLHEELDIPYAIMYRLVWEESRWKPWAINRSREWAKESHDFSRGYHDCLMYDTHYYY